MSVHDTEVRFSFGNGPAKINLSLTFADRDMVYTLIRFFQR